MSLPFQKLYSLGLTNFLVINVGPLGCAPGVLDAVFWSRGGCYKPINDVAEGYNAQLDAALAGLRQQLKGATILRFDVFKAYYTVASYQRKPTPRNKRVCPVIMQSVLHRRKLPA